MNFSKIPQELRNSARWVLWRLENVDGRERGKVPYLPRNPALRASSTDAATWDTFGKAQDALADFKPAKQYEDEENPIGLGYTFGPPYFGVDLDHCVDPVNGDIAPWVERIIAQLPATYTELSPSQGGLHLWYKCPRADKLPAGHRTEKAEVYSRGRYFTMTGLQVEGTPGTVTELDLAEARKVFALVESLKEKRAVSNSTTAVRLPEEEVYALLFAGKYEEAGYTDRSQADARFFHLLKKKFNGDAEKMKEIALRSALVRDKWTDRADYLDRTIADVLKDFKPKGAPIDPETWREGCYSFGQLPTDEPKYLIDKLIPEKALTMISAASYNCKTWFALAAGDAIAEAKNLWWFTDSANPVPVIYHVPEMNAAFVRRYMQKIGVRDSENFLVRPMEAGMWSLDDPRMLRSSEGRVVFLDTTGYFNPADDTSNYKQSLEFARLVYQLLEVGAVSVVGLYHPPKYSSIEKEDQWTLENSILGSAGYGGILRSCLRMANLNPDRNDPNVWVYVEGLKNPGLKPFQLCGPLPLREKVAPGESPYLRELLKGAKPQDERREKAFAMFEQGHGTKMVSQDLKVKKATVVEWKEEWQELRGVPRLKLQGDKVDF